MLKRTIVLILAACLLLCAVSFAEEATEEAQPAATEIAYESEDLVIRTGPVTVEGDSVTVTLAFEAGGTRCCSVMADLTESMWTDIDFFEALKLIKKINGNKVTQQAYPGKPAEYSLTWNEAGTYDRSVFMAVSEKTGIGLDPETVELKLEGIPKDLTAGLTVLVYDPEVEDAIPTVLLSSESAGTILDPSNYSVMLVRLVSAD